MAVPGPFDCFLALQGLRTLPLRVGRHNQAGGAGFLAGRDDIQWLAYPGLASGPAHPQAACAARQMRAGGGMMVSFVPMARGGKSARERAIAICVHADLHARGVAGRRQIAHRAARRDDPRLRGRLALEVPEALIRLSVGIEGAADLIEDLRQALDGA